MAAFSASRFVCRAISSMMLTRSAILCIALTVSCTALPPSSASRAPLTAIRRVSLLFAAFWLMMAFICSRFAVISWTEVACSVVPCDSACDADETWDDAATSAFAAERTLVSTRVTSPTNSPN